MKKMMLIINLLSFSNTILAQETLQEFLWPQLAQQGNLSAGEVLPLDKDINAAPLKLQNTMNEPNLFKVLIIDNPCFTQRCFALTGKVRYERIQGIGHLGMWVFYSEEEKYLQRTIDTDGPMRQLTNSSNWRDFLLPFTIKEDKTSLPIRLKFEVFLPGAGTVYLSSLRLVQFENRRALKATIKNLTPRVIKPWWSGRATGLIGAIGGPSLGLLGALIGTLNGMGRGKIIVIISLRLLLIIGLVSLGMGILALILSQPYPVYYPLLLAGVICSVLPLFLYRGVCRRFEQIELRKMQAMDTK